jgi:hypothetical protein
MPPPTINCARLIAYAVLDHSVGYRGHTSLYVGDQEVGRVPCLAITHDRRLRTYFLFFCNPEWDTLGTISYESVEAAHRGAERIFPGVSSHWIEAGITEEEAERFLHELFGDDRCNRCKKRADYVEALITQSDGTYLCDACSPEPLPDFRSDVG